jgi:glycosyltransferase involved in cell wall biosynthesis
VNDNVTSVIIGEIFEYLNYAKLEPELASLFNFMVTELRKPYITSTQREQVRIALSIANTFLIVSKSEDVAQCNFAIDIHGGLAALLQYACFGVPFFYDSQEIFSENIQGLSTEEKKFWNFVERTIQLYSIETFTVSPGIANYYKDEFETLTKVLPNWELQTPHSPFDNSLKSNTISEEINFVYLGRYAEDRGIEKLIEVWPREERFKLTLYIPNLPTGLIKKINNPYIILKSPLKENEIVNVLRNYDVGIIPYEYTYPYNHCSPNKLGQYFAAGIAIFANNLPFIASSIEESGAGLIFDWKSKNFSNQLQFFSRNSLSEMKMKSRDFFRECANFDSALLRTGVDFSIYASKKRNIDLDLLKDVYQIPVFNLEEPATVQVKYEFIKSSKHKRLNHHQSFPWKLEFKSQIFLILRRFLTSDFGARLKSKFSSETKYKLKLIIGYWN